MLLLALLLIAVLAVPDAVLQVRTRVEGLCFTYARGRMGAFKFP